jgi:hypothetical protein
MKQTITLIILSFFAQVSVSYGQCIKKFPYTYDFENFDSLQTTESCDATIDGDSADGWYQDQNDGGEWRADTAGTGSFGTGPGSTDNTSGVGSGTDYSPGRTDGIYLYTEASSATGCPGNEVNLLSPCIDLTGSSYYQLEFAYNMHGTEGIGQLFVDVYHNSAWETDVWSLKGDQGEGWNIAKVNLAKYKGSSVQLRIRAIMGRTFVADVAIDAITIKSISALDYDGEIVGARAYRNDGYGFMPKAHADSILYDVFIRNNGLKKITGVKIIVELPSSKDTFSYGDLDAFASDSLRHFAAQLPASSDGAVSTLTLILTETDGNTSNNTIKIENYHNDSMYSRDNGTWYGGVGSNGGTVEIGNLFDLQKDDTLTSVSFFINGGTAGDSVIVSLYNVTSNKPSGVIVSSDAYTLDGFVRWHTIKLGCDRELKAGSYFVGVRQLNTNNMGLGYTRDFYEPNKCLYSGAGWPEMVLFDGESVLVRMNFGEVKEAKIQIDLNDTICQNQEYLITATGASTYVWEPFGIIQSKTGNIVKMKANKDFTLKVIGTDVCGKTASIDQDITVISTPQLSVSEDTTVCEFQSVLLQAFTNTNYRWIGGPSNTNYGVNPGKTTNYVVEADSAFGCKSSRNVTVTVSKPEPTVTPDTTVCQAQPLRLVATGGTSYQWIGGSNTAVNNVNPNTDTDYVVKVTDSYNCSAFDTVSVKTIAGPPLYTSPDTSICFGNKVLISAYGADTYEWIGGPTTPDYIAQPLSTRSIFVRGYAKNGCYLTDSVHVFVAKIPKVSLRSDTTICESSSLDITANTSDDVKYDWSSGDTTKSLNVSPKVTTEYKVVVANSTGCFAEDSVLITVDPLPVIDFSMSQSHKNITILNNSINGDSHRWEFGDGDSSKEKSVTHKYRVHGDYTLKYTITNKCGSKDTSYTVEVENLSVEDIDPTLVDVYPNPTTGLLTIKISDARFQITSIDLLSIDGTLVKQWREAEAASSLSQEVNMEHVADGTYLLQIHTSEGVLSKRIVKHR